MISLLYSQKIFPFKPILVFLMIFFYIRYQLYQKLEYDTVETG